tara:strand:+ start:631 stop:1233 length:603 start_codon:yes stop_codon:yes gene_type:complete
MELSKQVAELSIRLERVERVEEGPVENVFAVADYKDFFGKEEITNDSDEEEAKDSDIIRVKSGFTAPAPTEVEESVQEDVEPLGKSEDVDSEVDPIEKEFDGEVLDEEALSEFAEREEQEIIEGIVEMVEKYIDDNHAILNNQLKKKIYSDVIPVNDKIKKGIKEALANHPRIKAHKLDKFRTLYYKGESPDEEYARAFN